MWIFTTTMTPLWILLHVFILACFCYVLYVYFIQPLYLMHLLRSQSIPCCPFIPFLGQVSEMKKINSELRSDPNYGGSMIPFLDVMLQRFGGAFVYCIGPQPRLVITEPAVIRKIYLEKNDIYHKTDILRAFRLFGNGVLTSSAELWFHQRKLLTSAFTGKEMKRLFLTMVECARSTFDQWLTQLQSEPIMEIDISRAFSALTLHVIGCTAFGSDIYGKNEASSLILQSFSDYLQSVIRYSRGKGLNPLYRILPSSEKRHIRELEAQIKHRMSDLIGNRMKIRKEKCKIKTVSHSNEIENTKNQNDDPFSGTPPLPIDILEILLTASENSDEKSTFKISNQLLSDNCFTFLLAGHETTSNLLTWTCLLLSQHPEWQEKARLEVFSILGTSEPLLHEHLSQMKVIGWVLNESLRLYPPVSMVTRKCIARNIVGNITVPKSVDIVVPVSYLHRSPKFWGPSSNEFNPMRFSNGIGKACNDPTTFMPFSLGPRTCIGQNFAMVEAKVLLSLMLLKFRWRLSPSYKHCPHVIITLTPKYGLQLILEPLV